MISLLSSFSVRVRPITYPETDNVMFQSFALQMLDKRPVKGPKEIFRAFAIGFLDEGIDYKEARFIRTK